MNVKDFRAKAYTRNAEGVPVPIEETASVKKTENNFQKTVFTQDIKAEDLTQKKESPSQALNNTVDYLKTGGLLKVPVEQAAPDGKDSVYRRVAKFLLLIGEDEAAKILPHLSETQIEKIIPEIASIRTVSKEEAAVIMEEFNGLLNKAREEGGVETAREMLEKAYGKKRADELLKKAMPLEGKIPFQYLRDADNERVYLLIKDENPGVQSMVLSHLEPKKAAKIINLMTAEEKKEVVMRLAKMEPLFLIEDHVLETCIRSDALGQAFQLTGPLCLRRLHEVLLMQLHIAF